MKLNLVEKTENNTILADSQTLQNGHEFFEFENENHMKKFENEITKKEDKVEKLKNELSELKKLNKENPMDSLNSTIKNLENQIKSCQNGITYSKSKFKIRPLPSNENQKLVEQSLKTRGKKVWLKDFPEFTFELKNKKPNQVELSSLLDFISSKLNQQFKSLMNKTSSLNDLNDVTLNQLQNMKNANSVLLDLKNKLK